ncbi:MAG: lipid kinase [Beijerinckiaceae bacterium]|nr:lipid kinase [Beijerinckiaceae bacterium]MDO9439741.1 lipid kinase [Beijerinckiaceae bacterium]
MTSKRVLLLVNSKSRRGEESRAQVVQSLSARGFSIVLPSAQEMEDCSALIRRRAQEVDLILVGGGDGSLNAAAPGLLDVQRPFGILPLGTANDLARTLGIPPTIEQALEVIVGGHTRWIDVGMVNDKPFFNVASLGISAQLAMSLTSQDKKRFGQLGYALAGLRVLLNARPFSALIIGPRTSARVKSYQIAVGNGLYYGGGMAVAEHASIDDHQLHLYSLEIKEVWKLALMARAFRAGRHGAFQEVRVEDGRRFEVRTRKPKPINADGEIITHTPAVFSVRPSALEVFVPQPQMT